MRKGGRLECMGARRYQLGLNSCNPSATLKDVSTAERKVHHDLLRKLSLPGHPIRTLGRTPGCRPLPLRGLPSQCRCAVCGMGDVPGGGFDDQSRHTEDDQRFGNGDAILLPRLRNRFVLSKRDGSPRNGRCSGRNAGQSERTDPNHSDSDCGTARLGNAHERTPRARAVSGLSGARATQGDTALFAEQVESAGVRAPV